MKIEFGRVVLDERARVLEKVIKGWGKAIHHYASLHDENDEAIYAYNERANLSLLAGGAWLSGGAAVEEYSSTKTRGGRSKYGRVDLYLSGKTLAAEVEAKQKWIKPTTTDKLLRRDVQKALSAASDDAKGIDGADSSFACAFFVPRFSKRRFKDYDARSASLIEAYVERFIHLKDAHVWAWCFPERTRFVESDAEASYYPGIVMGIKGVRY